MTDLIGKRFTVHGIEYAVIGKVDNGNKWRVSPVGNPLTSEVLPKGMLEDLLEKEKASEVTLLDKLNISNIGCRTMSSSIILELTEEEFEFVKTWVNVGMKYEEMKNK